ncbi:MAG TPA: ATP-binding cassette domain-containing protein [Blastocatellia bacterium]|nr:ATP-binding cassette domain-containing protein [Blastocatellia bacterium]
MSIILEQISKRYGNLWVVDQVSLEIKDGELFVLLGSSGSGKSTILRLIAGLAEPTSGRILLGGRDVTHLTPQERGTGFVFQNYSIFRHMSVAENIEFGLKIRKVAKAERRRRTDELLELVGLAGLGRRYAHQLSGGQQQRVALARALVYEPDVLLLDEPFGALDVKIRAQLRRSLKEIQRRLGVTAILVTHDQEEAFELADRIGVLESGRLLEVGAGEELYAAPKSLFTATFLGAGTVIVGRARQGEAQFGPISLPIPPDVPHEEGARVRLLFRPEQVALSADGPPADLPVIGKGRLVEESFTGPLRRVRLRLPRMAGTRQIAPAPAFGEEELLVDAAFSSETNLNGQELWVALRGWTILKQPQMRLLVCDDGTGPTAPLSISRLLVERLGATATVLAVAENAEAGEQLRATVKQRQAGAELEQEDLHIRFGNASEQIAAEQAESLYEMLVLATRPRPRTVRRPVRDSKAFARLLGETVVTALERADIPVLVAKSERAGIEKILICTAAGEPGKSDVRVGGQLARRLNAKVTLFYVTRMASSPDLLTSDHLERAARTLRAMDVESDVRIRPAAGPAAGIMAEAEEGDYDLIVMGSHGPRLRKLFKLDDVTLQVLAEANRPVLVVPAEKA